MKKPKASRNKKAQTPKKTSASKTERLQKILAQAGVASRRNAEKLIVEGAVHLNGKRVTELGTKANPKTDKIKVHGKLILTDLEPELLYVALNKPSGVISALSDPQNRPHLGRILRRLPTRVNPIGRLGVNVEGLMLLTNDGELAEKISKQRKIDRTYLIKVRGRLQQRDLVFLKKRFLTKRGVIEFLQYNVKTQLKNKTILKLRVLESSKADLKDLFNAKGMLVEWVERIAIGGIRLTGLAPGEYRFHTKKDFERLLK